LMFRPELTDDVAARRAAGIGDVERAVKVFQDFLPRSRNIVIHFALPSGEPVNDFAVFDRQTGFGVNAVT